MLVLLGLRMYHFHIMSWSPMCTLLDKIIIHVHFRFQIIDTIDGCMRFLCMHSNYSELMMSRIYLLFALAGWFLAGYHLILWVLLSPLTHTSHLECIFTVNRMCCVFGCSGMWLGNFSVLWALVYMPTLSLLANSLFKVLSGRLYESGTTICFWSSDFHLIPAKGEESESIFGLSNTWWS